METTKLSSNISYAAVDKCKSNVSTWRMQALIKIREFAEISLIEIKLIEVGFLIATHYKKKNSFTHNIH